jgi:flagellar biosynthesis chaperone FliJ
MQYRQKIYENLLQKMEQKEVNHEWLNIKSTIIELAEEIIKTQERNICKEWWDEECKEAISKKNTARKKC